MTTYASISMEYILPITLPYTIDNNFIPEIGKDIPKHLRSMSAE